MARPTKLTPEISAKILMALKAGNYLNVAAAAAGISQATLHRWKQDKRPAYREFREDVDRSIAEGEVLLVASAARAALQKPIATMRFLERRHPEKWGRARADAAYSAPDETIHLALIDEAPRKPEGLMGDMVNLPPEWAYPIYKLIAAAARGRTPEQFFEGHDRLAGLREGDSPSPQWWKLDGVPVDLVASTAPDETKSSPGERTRLSTEATPIDD